MECPATNHKGFAARCFQMVTIMIKTNIVLPTGFHYWDKLLGKIMIPRAEVKGFCPEQRLACQKMQSPWSPQGSGGEAWERGGGSPKCASAPPCSPPCEDVCWENELLLHGRTHALIYIHTSTRVYIYMSVGPAAEPSQGHSESCPSIQGSPALLHRDL